MDSRAGERVAQTIDSLTKNQCIAIALAHLGFNIADNKNKTEAQQAVRGAIARLEDFVARHIGVRAGLKFRMEFADDERVYEAEVTKACAVDGGGNRVFEVKFDDGDVKQLTEREVRVAIGDPDMCAVPGAHTSHA